MVRASAPDCSSRLACVHRLVVFIEFSLVLRLLLVVVARPWPQPRDQSRVQGQPSILQMGPYPIKAAKPPTVRDRILHYLWGDRGSCGSQSTRCGIGGVQVLSVDPRTLQCRYVRTNARRPNGVRGGNSSHHRGRAGDRGGDGAAALRPRGFRGRSWSPP